MRLLSITCLLCITELTGCALWKVTPTKPINAADLSVRHVYKSPEKNKLPHHFKHFNDPQLHQLISVALADSPDMRGAQARVQRAQQITKGAYSTLWPSATLSGYLEKQSFDFHGVVPPPFNEIVAKQASIADIALNFNYEIDFWGKNRATVASKLSETYAAQMDWAETGLILSATVANAYFELQDNMTQFQLAKENARLQKQLSDIVLDRAKQGIESDIPVKTALANTQTSLLSVEDYKRAEMQSRHQLAVLLGKNPFTTQIEAAPFKYHKKQLTLPEIIPANLLAQRPDIAAARALAESAAQQIKVARAAFFPNINLKGVLGSQSFYFTNMFNVSFQNAGVTGALNLPIFDAGARKANLGVKYNEYELAVNQYNQTILYALRQVSDQLSALNTLNKQITAQGKALNTTESNYKLFQSRYTQGIIDYVQLIEIKQLLIQQKAMLLHLQTQRMQAFVTLTAALGGEVSL